MKTKPKAIKAPKPAASPTEAAKPTIPHLRPGLIINDDSWTGPSIVIAVDREAGQATLLTSVGIQTQAITSLNRGVPSAESPLDLLADAIASAVKTTPGILPGIIAPEPTKAGMGRVMDLIGQAIDAIYTVENQGTHNADFQDALHDVWQALLDQYNAMGRILTDASTGGSVDETPELDNAAGKILASLKSFPKPATWGGPPREGVADLIAVLNMVGGAIEKLHTFAQTDAAKKFGKNPEDYDAALWTAHADLLSLVGDFLHESMNTSSGEALKAVKMPTKRTNSIASTTTNGILAGTHLDVIQFHRLAVLAETALKEAWSPSNKGQTGEGEERPGSIDLALDGQKLPEKWEIERAEERELMDAVEHVRITAGNMLASAYAQAARAAAGGGQ